MRKPNLVEFTKKTAITVADFYEYSMAEANTLEGIMGKQSVFDLVERRLPTNKVVGTFEHDGVKYDQLAKRDFMITVGLEQAAACFLEVKGSKRLAKYLKKKQGITNKKFLGWAKNIHFQGDVYAMPEGTIFFAQESQMRVHERFEEAQVYESLILDYINPQTNVATTANDIASVADKILLEGGSRRAASPHASITNSRAARIGGFTSSSNMAYGELHNEKSGGTHGHSYVMIHPDEYSAFKAQAKLFGDKVCFLLDTYNVKKAFETALEIVKQEQLNNFAFRIDSGDLLQQAKWIHTELKSRGYNREDYAIVASDDLTAGKIGKLEKEGADIDKYLIGTYIVNPPKTAPGVYKLAAYYDSVDSDSAAGSANSAGKESTKGLELILRGKFSEDIVKSTLPGIKQVYRITGNDGFYKKDIIALEGESVDSYLEAGDSVEALLVPIIKNGKQVYDFPVVPEISRRRKEQLLKFKDIKNYQVIISDGILQAQDDVRRKYNNAK